MGKRYASTPTLPKEDSISVEIIENFISGKDRDKILSVAEFSNYIKALKEYPKEWTIFDYVANYAVVDKVENPSMVAIGIFGFIAKKDPAQCSAMLIKLIHLHKFLKALVYGK